VTLSGGKATLTGVVLSGIGTHTITVNYAGVSNLFFQSSSTTSVAVGQDFTLTAPGSTGTTLSSTVTAGDAAVFGLQFAPQAGSSTFASAVTFTLTGYPAGATYTITPSTIAAGSGTTAVTVTVMTAKQQTTAASSSPKGGIGFPKLALLAFCLPLFGMRKLRRALRAQMKSSALLLVMLAVLMVAGMTACGSGSGFLAQTPQAYPMTLTGTSGALHHSVTLNLTVQ
jgi:hypothetical protein